MSVVLPKILYREVPGKGRWNITRVLYVASPRPPGQKPEPGARVSVLRKFWSRRPLGLDFTGFPLCSCSTTDRLEPLTTAFRRVRVVAVPIRRNSRRNRDAVGTALRTGSRTPVIGGPSKSHKWSWEHLKAGRCCGTVHQNQRMPQLARLNGSTAGVPVSRPSQPLHNSQI